MPRARVLSLSLSLSLSLCSVLRPLPHVDGKGQKFYGLWHKFYALFQPGAGLRTHTTLRCPLTLTSVAHSSRRPFRRKSPLIHRPVAGVPISLAMLYFFAPYARACIRVYPALLLACMCMHDHVWACTCMYVCACIRALSLCMRVRVRVRVCACACACAGAGLSADAFAWLQPKRSRWE